MRVPSLAKLGILLTTAYVCFVLWSFPRSPSSKPVLQRNSPARKTLQKPLYHKTTADYANWRDMLPELLEQPGDHYVLFVSGTKDGTPEGMPWCGDCFAASPIVRQLVKRIGGALLEVQAGSIEEWHKKDNPLRIDAEAPLKYIPTLYHWTHAGAGAYIASQLNGRETPENLKKVVAKFLQDTAGKSRSVMSMAQEILETKAATKKCTHC